jgi:hypothetical protein
VAVDPRPGARHHSAPSAGGAGTRPVDVRGDGIHVDRVRSDVGVREVRGRFGGIDPAAIAAGTLSALGAAVLIGSSLAAIGSVAYQLGVDDDDSVSLGGIIAGALTLLVAFFIGGWVAGRMARYDGGRNGLLAAACFVVLAALGALVGAIFGDRHDVFRDINLPQWFRSGAFTWGAVASTILGIAAIMFAAYLGGRIGSRYHERADALLVATRDGGISGRDEVVGRGRVTSFSAPDRAADQSDRRGGS